MLARTTSVVVSFVVTLLVGAVLLSACTQRHARPARRVGAVMAVAGVAGLVAAVAVSPYTDHEDPFINGFSLMSGAGIITFAIGDLSDPRTVDPPETEDQKLTRWARELTEKAVSAARKNQCERVRELEQRVHLYDRNVHDFVFMRDPAILRCLSLASAPAPV
jgi:hypothetical protein